MQFINEFTVPADPGRTFATLTDLEQVAPCLPGATLEGVDGDTFLGKVKVKVGPIQVVYAGGARVTEADEGDQRARIEANGKEVRGAGTATADVVAQLAETAQGTQVTVTTDLTITGKAAQFGRGVMEEVGSRIIDSFAQRLSEMLSQGPAPASEPATASPPSPPAPPGDPEPPTTDSLSGSGTELEAPQPPGRRDVPNIGGQPAEAVDLLSVAGWPAIKRVLPPVALLAALFWMLRWWRRR